MSPDNANDTVSALVTAAREVEEFVASGGWDQPTQVFALVPTAELLAAEPTLSEQLDPASALTPIAQESLPSDDLSESLARISWPDQVTGCAIVQEIVVLPPEAEAELPEDPEHAKQAAAEHPDRHEARLVAAVLRDGGQTCVMRLRGTDDDPGQVVQDESLAPNLLLALRETFN